MEIEDIKKNGILLPNVSTIEGYHIWDDEILGLKYPWVWVYKDKLIVTLPTEYLKFKENIIKAMERYSDNYEILNLKIKFTNITTEKIIFNFKEDIARPLYFMALDNCPYSIGLKGLFTVLF